MKTASISHPRVAADEKWTPLSRMWHLGQRRDRRWPCLACLLQVVCQAGLYRDRQGGSLVNQRCLLFDKAPGLPDMVIPGASR